MNSGCPTISVIMSVYNTNKSFLAEAIESILNQTYPNFEFIIIDDNSTDGSLSIIEQYMSKDDRIVLIKNKTNIGLTKSLNKGLKLAKGQYIARMDADDVSLPDRFKQQIEYMENNSHVTVIGGIAYSGAEVTNRWFNENTKIEKALFLFGNAGIAHPTAFIRKSFLDFHHIKYDENLKKSQDYALWLDIVQQGGVIQRLPEFVLKYRIHEGQISKASSD